MAELKRFLGLPPETSVRLRDTLEVLAAPPFSGEAPNLDERPDVREAQARVRLAQARITEAQADGRVDLTLFGSDMRMDAGFPQRGFGAGGELERVRGAGDSSDDEMHLLIMSDTDFLAKIPPDEVDEYYSWVA
jgi:hypothetical protein